MYVLNPVEPPGDWTGASALPSGPGHKEHPTCRSRIPIRTCTGRSSDVQGRSCDLGIARTCCACSTGTLVPYTYSNDCRALYRRNSLERAASTAPRSTCTYTCATSSKIMEGSLPVPNCHACKHGSCNLCPNGFLLAKIAHFLHCHAAVTSTICVGGSTLDKLATCS